MSLDLTALSQREASLVQHGLKALGYYSGTTRGIPGPKTKAALAAYLGREEPTSVVGKMIELARAEVGVREHPKDSNRGKRVEEYQAATWLDGTGWPWCAAFICWLCREAGMGDGLRPKTPGAWAFEGWARRVDTPVKLIKPLRSAKVRAGDIVVFTFSHIGFAVGDQDGDTVRTIEGNTDAAGSREGGGVYEKTRKVSQIRSLIRFQ